MNEQIHKYLQCLILAIADRKNTSMKRDGLIHALAILYELHENAKQQERDPIKLLRWAETHVSGTVAEAVASHMADRLAGERAACG